MIVALFCQLGILFVVIFFMSQVRLTWSVSTKDIVRMLRWVPAVRYVLENTDMDKFKGAGVNCKSSCSSKDYGFINCFWLIIGIWPRVVLRIDFYCSQLTDWHRPSFWSLVIRVLKLIEKLQPLSTLLEYTFGCANIVRLAYYLHCLSTAMKPFSHGITLSSEVIGHVKWMLLKGEVLEQKYGETNYILKETEGSR